MIIDKKFLSMEDNVIKRLINNATEYKDILLQQYENIVKVTRKFDECGFFTSFEINKDKCVAIDKSLTINSVYGIFNDEYIKVDFLLFVRNGYITTLECTKIFEEIFPDRIKNYTLCKELRI